MRIPFLGGIGVPELIIILIVVLLIFGPKNLPKLGNAIGRTVKSMRDGMESKKKAKEEVTEVESTEPQKAQASNADDDAEDAVVEEIPTNDDTANKQAV